MPRVSRDDSSPFAPPPLVGPLAEPWSLGRVVRMLRMFGPAAVLASAVLAAAALYLPALGSLLGTEPLAGADLLPPAAAAVIGFAAARLTRTTRRS